MHYSIEKQSEKKIDHISCYEQRGVASQFVYSIKKGNKKVCCSAAVSTNIKTNIN